MNILTLEQIKKALESRTLTHVSEHSGVHYDTLRNIRKGRQTDITLSTAEKLSKYFEEH